MESKVAPSDIAVKCKYCKTDGLQWTTINSKWLLVNSDNVVHCCAGGELHSRYNKQTTRNKELHDDETTLRVEISKMKQDMKRLSSLLNHAHIIIGKCKCVSGGMEQEQIAWLRRVKEIKEAMKKYNYWGN